MPARNGNQTLAKQYREKYGWDMPSAKLARILYNENKLSFSNLTSARINLLRLEGKSGAKGKPGVVMEIPERPKNPYKLPKSDESTFEPFEIKGHKRIAVFSDIHVPYHSIEAITAAIDYCRKEKPDAIILNGDTIDCHRLSKYVKDPKSRNFALELDSFKELIQVFEKSLKCKIYFKVGNHEERYENFLIEKAHELVGVKEFEFENIIKARANGISIIDDKRPMKIGGLWGIHGHEYVGGISAPVNPARGLFNRSKVCSFQGHNHQTSEHTEPTMSGKMITTWSLGCLSDLHPKFMRFNKWCHGFAIIDVDDQDFEFRNKRIYKGKVL
jgi:predicted phosphodiesterase